jgi:hypothetical protein
MDRTNLSIHQLSGLFLLTQQKGNGKFPHGIRVNFLVTIPFFLFQSNDLFYLVVSTEHDVMVAGGDGRDSFVFIR